MRLVGRKAARGELRERIRVRRSEHEIEVGRHTTATRCDERSRHTAATKGAASHGQERIAATADRGHRPRARLGAASSEGRVCVDGDVDKPVALSQGDRCCIRLPQDAGGARADRRQVARRNVGRKAKLGVARIVRDDNEPWRCEDAPG